MLHGCMFLGRMVEENLLDVKIVWRVKTEATTGGVLSEKVFLEILQNSQENGEPYGQPQACHFIEPQACNFIEPQACNGEPQKACNFIKKETLAQVFFCEFCEISENTFFTEHRPGNRTP